MAFSMMEAHNLVCRVNRSGAALGSPPHKVQSAATTLLYEMEQTRDDSRQNAKRTTKILGPINRRRIAQILPAIRSASRATRSGLAVSIIGILCHVFVPRDASTIRKMIKTCRIGCQDQPNCLGHYNECLRFATIFASCIRCMVDEFEIPHNHHRHNSENPETFKIAWRSAFFGDSFDAGVRSRISKFMSSKTPVQHLGSELQTPCSQGQVSQPTQYSHKCTPKW